MAFLAVWVTAAVAQAVMQWVAAVVMNRSRLAFGRRAFRQAIAENDRVLRFMLQTNFSQSVTMFWVQLGTLAVGAVAGPAEAGGFRLARRISKGILRPVQPVILAIYPELTRLVAEDNHAQLRTVVTRVTLAAGAVALLVVLFTGVASHEILHILAGEKFEFAAGFLFLLSLATAIDLAGFAFEPLQNAHGRSWNVLKAKLIAAAVYGAFLFVLLPRYGGNGAAVAQIVCSLVIFVLLAIATARQLKTPRKSRPPLEQPPQPNAGAAAPETPN